jgi:hypothetical protein
VICKGFEYRYTLNTRALTVSIVVVDGKVLRPTRSERSRTGAHGTDYYCLSEEEWSRTWTITLIQSNSGKRYVDFSDNVPPNIREIVEYLWLNKGVSVEKIEKTIQVLSKIYTELSESNE